MRELHYPPEKVWEVLTDPAQLREWSAFDADGSLAVEGSKVTLTTIGAPQPHITETTVKQADAPKLFEYQWGGGNIRWQLEPMGEGTRLTLWHNIGDRRYIAMGAAGWHLCIDVMDRYLAGDPMGRTVGPDALKVEGWQQLFKEYSEQFGVEMPKW